MKAAKQGIRGEQSKRAKKKDKEGKEIKKEKKAREIVNRKKRGIFSWKDKGKKRLRQELEFKKNHRYAALVHFPSKVILNVFWNAKTKVNI